MKKILSVCFAVLIFVLSFVGCDSEPIVRESYRLNDVFVGTGEENGFSYILFEDHAEITEYEAEEGIIEVEFPSELGGKPVTVIRTAVMSGNLTLQKAIIPTSVTDIGAYLFSGCTSLKSVTIPKSVRKIGASAFYDTPWIEGLEGEFVTVGDGVLIKYGGKGGDIVIPENVKYVTDAMFGNAKIHKITVPESVMGLSDYAFFNCGSLTEISIPDSMWDIGINSFDGTTWIAGESDEFVTVGDGVLVAYNGTATDVVIPEGIKYVMGGFEANKEITSVIFPTTLKNVGNNVFRECSALQKIVFSGADTKIGATAFMDCSSLTDVKLPQNLQVIENGLFNSCTKLENIEFPGSIKYVGVSVFYNCGKLKSVNIPNGTLEIGKGAFFGCPEVKTVSLPDSIVKLGDAAFACCFEIEEFKIPPAVSEITDALFSYCIKIKKIELSERIKSVGDAAFEACDNIEITVLNDNTVFSDDALVECEDTAKIIANEESAAKKFAEKKKVKFEKLK